MDIKVLNFQMSKRNADYSAEVVEFNSNPGSLLLLAWNKSTFNMSPATGAEITHIDNAGFDINIFFRFSMIYWLC